MKNKGKKAFIYIDDDETIIDAFSKTVRKVWNLNYDVLSNKMYGKIDDAEYDNFEEDVCTLIEENLDRIECVFLDLDFSGSDGDAGTVNIPDSVGFNLGIEIRRRWPQLPIIIASRFTEKEIIRKGLVFDFDNITEGITLIQMNVEEFQGMLYLAQQKRQKIIDSFGDIPVSFRIGRNKYFRRWDDVPEMEQYAFVAMPFSKLVVSNDVWEFGVKGGIEENGLEAVRVDGDSRSTPILEKIATYIFECDLVIADLTGWNANVLYELGLAHASNKDCVLLCQGDTKKFELPFDVQHMKVIEYASKDLAALKKKLSKAIEQILAAKDPSV